MTVFGYGLRILGYFCGCAHVCERGRKGEGRTFPVRVNYADRYQVSKLNEMFIVYYRD